MMLMNANDVCIVCAIGTTHIYFAENFCHKSYMWTYTYTCLKCGWEHAGKDFDNLSFSLFLSACLLSLLSVFFFLHAPFFQKFKGS